MTDKMRFAIVGAGVIAPFHAKAIAGHPDAELVAIADVEKDKANKMAEEYAIPYVYTDYEQMLKQGDIDVISVAVPSGMHGEVTIASAQAGKHVFCEKPLEITSEKMTQMIEACKRSNVKLGCVFQRRVMPASIVAKRSIEEGKLGKLVLGDAYLKYYRSPEYYRSAGWRGTWALDGGGALMNQGVHGIDLIQWLAGDVHSVFAYSAPLLRDIEVEDTAVAVLKYKNGAFGVIQGTTSVFPSQETRFELHGENGTIIFGDSGFKQWKFAGSDEEMPQVEGMVYSGSDPSKIASDGHYILLDDMIRAIRDDRAPLVSGEDARKSVELILAIYESSRSSKEVVLNSDFSGNEH
ncbi:Gfo/Idh/MocA family oxidoreductase [Paenibacillus filicis]|uniref:Gfo/Idh/MocA family oxidoreductase n=1 Tax=Paenibacillus gyeongsangnamensis TaxID=3388067 RepID=A0ABT4Q460_9BACL|nr:Gfo/Idh/MocA family oxidoreductase [Paenibacillus filicis]MCZ8511670.1 Gfo/Idh/MocA family oxidoreductase [Paenibacillus filicis]